MHRAIIRGAGALAAVRILCEPPASLTARTMKQRLATAAQYGYPIYDGLIPTATLDAECNTPYSEDMQAGQRIGSLTIHNPFVTG